MPDIIIEDGPFEDGGWDLLEMLTTQCTVLDCLLAYRNNTDFLMGGDEGTAQQQLVENNINDCLELIAFYQSTLIDAKRDEEAEVRKAKIEAKKKAKSKTETPD